MSSEIKCGGTTESTNILYIKVLVACTANSVSKKKPSRSRCSAFWGEANTYFEPPRQLQMGRG